MNESLEAAESSGGAAVRSLLGSASSETTTQPVFQCGEQGHCCSIDRSIDLRVPGNPPHTHTQPRIDSSMRGRLLRFWLVVRRHQRLAVVVAAVEAGYTHCCCCEMMPASKQAHCLTSTTNTKTNRDRRSMASSSSLLKRAAARALALRRAPAAAVGGARRGFTPSAARRGGQSSGVAAWTFSLSWVVGCGECAAGCIASPSSSSGGLAGRFD